MAKTIIMPKSGMAMEEGVIIKWLKKEGDKIEKGEPVLEVETDKSTMEVEADYAGTLVKIVYNEGDTVPVTEVVGWIGEPGEEIPEAAKKPAAGDAVDDAAGASADEKTAVQESAPAAAAEAAEAPSVGEGGRVRATPAARRIAKEKNIDLAGIVPGGKYGEVRAADVSSAQSGAGRPVKATPLAGRIAEKEGIELAGLAGSGKDGKIFSKDIAAVLAAKRADAAEAEAAGAAGAGSLEPERLELNNIQRITGKRMLASHLEIPPVTVNAEADVTDLLAIRKELNAEGDMHITVNDFVLKAVVRALLKNPRMNASIDTEREELLIYPNVHLGVAVATLRGLLVPVIKNAERKTLLELSGEMAEIREKAADGKLDPDDLTGSTFTVSNIGKYGVTSFTPIINQPEAGILGVCAIQDRLVRIDGEICDRKILGLSLTFDHRIVDGAESAEFIQSLVGLLEKPVKALV